MTTLAVIFLSVATLANCYFLFNIFSMRDLMRKAFANPENIKRIDLKILYSISKDDPILSEYVIYNAPTFIYPFAAVTISSTMSIFQILSGIIFIVFLLKLNFMFMVFAGILTFFSGYTGSRFNRKLMFSEAVQNFGKKVAGYDQNFFHQKLSAFHENYYKGLSK